MGQQCRAFCRYVIPVDVVLHFITDFDRNGRFTGFPILGIEWQKMESPYMRKAMGMKACPPHSPVTPPLPFQLRPSFAALRMCAFWIA